MRGRVDEHGVRIYEVANGSYNMTLNWYGEEKECKMKINISDDGTIKFIESNDITWKQIAAHKKVKVGKQYEANSLYDAHLRKEVSEIVKVSQKPSTSMGSVTISKQLSSAQGASK
ncbi:hypothetical protein [Wolbachia endosymbiont of Trichogramma pretiosum]|uniref:hypothetical protein n=1 Tax=Wolbachia endosymbiont of Trichogramma pretiosum TaxID=125593 RepID=UPI000AA35483|nr:hypothetical protein [Wolbachia endosymbiont of Trichogramma pretiosum]OCA06007.1 hypothetical protein wTpre_328 [Wolbachia endosymbiont of Trichogramma pretiosum]